MNKRLCAGLIILALLLTMLCGCKGPQEELGVTDNAVTDPDKTPDQPQTDNSEKNPEEQAPADRPADGDTPQTDTPTNTPTAPDSPAPDQQPSTPNTSTEQGLTALQKAGTAFTIAAGETVWFGPMPITQEVMLTLDGKAIKKEAVTEVDKLGGGYRLYSYKAAAAGSVTVTAPEAVSSIFLISKGQKMTSQEFYAHLDRRTGVNLYDPTLDSTGKTIRWDGKESNSTTEHLSHAIAVSVGDALTFGPCNPAQVVLAYGYDAKGKATTLINASNLTQTARFEKGLALYTYTVPNGVTALRLLVPETVKKDTVILKNKTLTAAEYQQLTGTKTSTLADPLKKATGLFAGDSINHGLSSRDEAAPSFKDGTGGWAARIERDTGLIATNVGKSGYHFTDVKSNYGPINDLLNPVAGKDFDYVLLQGGYNDACKGVPLGEVSDSFDISDFDTTTFAGGLERTLYNAVRYYGDTAAFGFLITFKIPKDKGIEAPYYQLAKQICDKWGIPYLDLYNNQKLNTDLKYDTKEHTNDYVHPDASDYELITPYVIDFMHEMTPCRQEVLQQVMGK